MTFKVGFFTVYICYHDIFSRHLAHEMTWTTIFNDNNVNII